VNPAVKRIYRELLTGAWVVAHSTSWSLESKWRQFVFKLLGRRESIETTTDLVCTAGEWNFNIEVHYLRLYGFDFVP
jgi:hypothetical protein